jgi:metal-responsive CopG/Arc/MetJ family transcriptional regulator
MLYIMKRTQLYLDEDLWQALHTKAAIEKTTVSDLVRTAARERYLEDSDKRREALMGIVGIWKDRTDLPDTETYVRNLRKGSRLKRLGIV